ncbi:kinase-like domain-containing protein [Gilbertella persicaria]|uniref:kinase-like domain-containing protein n=1 Tax=Gilbertella persicaria TaxID=101096 RepID=UPI0022208424|nr:kinase-like domain-containing protein [Gilbertella persicaria]KAI8094931.1 kinase-like domain-containing protein [Gilbertella persicaria]
MTKLTIMKRIVALFKKTHEKKQEPGYPSDLTSTYKVTKKTLGVGSFAVVKECIHRSTGHSFALKIILKKAIAVRHPHIVSMHHLYESKDAVYIIVHRDMKPENLLFQTNTENANLMITDFGLSKILKGHDDILTTACGTPGYVAPEVLLQTGHNKPVDLWSVGVMLFTLLSGYTPFWGEDQASLFQSIMSGEYEYDEEYWSDISQSAKNLIDRLLTFDPNKRITAEEALLHPWITGSKEAGPRSSTNLAPVIRKGYSSRGSFVGATLMYQLGSSSEESDDDEVFEKQKNHDIEALGVISKE